MDGVHLVLTADLEISLLWRHPFPDWICTQLSFCKNPEGCTTNSDLELAGSIAQNNILTQAADITEIITYDFYDNIAAVSW